MTDFSVARQCWLAALWGLHSLQMAVESQVCDASDNTLTLDRLTDNLIDPELAVYGAERVLPVLVVPIYRWLEQAMCAVLEGVGRYHQLDNEILSRVCAMLRGEEPWEDSPFVTERSQVAARKQIESDCLESGRLELCRVEWDWLLYYWSKHQDSLPGFVQDLREMVQALPSTSAKRGGVSSIVAGAAHHPESPSVGGVGNGRYPGSRFISVEQLPAWHPEIVRSRVELVRMLLADLGDRWVES